MNGREKALTATAIAGAIVWAFARSAAGKTLTVDAVAAIIGAGGRVIDLARELIAGEEGLRLTVYPDSGGAWTIGWGHLVKRGERFHPYGTVTTITREEADALFEADLREARQAIQRYVVAPLTDTQRAALESLVFNIGADAFASSTLRAKLNARDYAGAAAEFARWVYDNGRVVPGLVARRAREREVFAA